MVILDLSPKFSLVIRPCSRRVYIIRVSIFTRKELLNSISIRLPFTRSRGVIIVFGQNCTLFLNIQELVPRRCCRIINSLTKYSSRSPGRQVLLLGKAACICVARCYIIFGLRSRNIKVCVYKKCTIENRRTIKIGYSLNVIVPRVCCLLLLL